MRQLLVLIIGTVFFANVAAAQWLPMNSPTEEPLMTALIIDDYKFIFGYNDANFRTNDSGATWEQLSINGSILVAKYIDNRIFVAGVDGLAKTSNDMGVTWNDVSVLSEDNDIVDIVKVNDKIVFIPYKAYFATVLDVNSNSIDTLELPYTFNEPYYAELGFSYDGRLFLAAGEHIKATAGPVKGLYYTDDLGENWEEVTSFAPQVIGSVSSVYVDANEIFMAINSTGSSGPSILVSYDGGMNWSTFFQIEEYDHFLTSVYVDQNGEVLASGGYWENSKLYGFVLENEIISSISDNGRLNYITGNDSDLIVVGDYGSIYSRGTTSIDDQPEVSLDMIAYPNPCVDKLNIQFNSLSGPVDVRIYNTAGKLIQSLIATEDVTIDFASRPSGIYFINIGGKTTKIVKQ